jgi:hypothetical protein
MSIIEAILLGILQGVTEAQPYTDRHRPWRDAAGGVNLFPP